MNNLTGEVHEEELNSSNYAYAESEEVQKPLSKSNLGQIKTKKSSLEHRTIQLPKEAAIGSAQQVLSEEMLTLPATIIFYASPPAAPSTKEKKKKKRRILPQKFVKKFNDHREEIKNTLGQSFLSHALQNPLFSRIRA